MMFLFSVSQIFLGFVAYWIAAILFLTMLAALVGAL